MTVPRRPYGATLWERIYRTLSDEINAGQYPAGAKLPTEAELSRRFAVNRHTVRRALDALQEEGRIHVRRGAGSFVTQGRIDYRIGLRTRLTHNLAEIGLSAGRRLLRVETVAADQRQAEALEIARAGAVRRDRLHPALDAVDRRAGRGADRPASADERGVSGAAGRGGERGHGRPTGRVRAILVLLRTGATRCSGHYVPTGQGDRGERA